MADQSLLEVLIQIIHDIQTQSGDPVGDIDEQTIPINDVEGFDSQRGIETTIEIETRLGIILPEGINLFVSEDHRPLSLLEIAIRVKKLSEKRDKSK